MNLCKGNRHYFIESMVTIADIEDMFCSFCHIQSEPVRYIHICHNDIKNTYQVANAAGGLCEACHYAIINFPYMFKIQPTLHCINCRGWYFFDQFDNKWITIKFNSAIPTPTQRANFKTNLMDTIEPIIGSYDLNHLEWSVILNYKQPFLPTIRDVVAAFKAFKQLHYEEIYANCIENVRKFETSQDCFTFTVESFYNKLPDLELFDEHETGWVATASSVLLEIYRIRYCLELIWSPTAPTLEEFQGCARNAPCLQPWRNFLFKPFPIEKKTYNLLVTSVKNIGVFCNLLRSNIRHMTYIDPHSTTSSLVDGVDDDSTSPSTPDMTPIKDKQD